MMDEAAFNLPSTAVRLPIALSFPISCKPQIEKGSTHENSGRVRVYSEPPWLHLWLGDRSYGVHEYALEMGEVDGRYRVLAAWVIDPNHAHYIDDDRARERITSCLDSIAGTYPVHFSSDSVSGTRDRNLISFNGKVRSFADVESVALALHDQVARMEQEDHDKWE